MKRNGIQIGAKDIENLLVTSIIPDHGIDQKKSSKKTQFEETPLHNPLHGLNISSRIVKTKDDTKQKILPIPTPSFSSSECDLPKVLLS